MIPHSHFGIVTPVTPSIIPGFGRRGVAILRSSQIHLTSHRASTSSCDTISTAYGERLRSTDNFRVTMQWRKLDSRMGSMAPPEGHAVFLSVGSGGFMFPGHPDILPWDLRPCNYSNSNRRNLAKLMASKRTLSWYFILLKNLEVQNSKALYQAQISPNKM